MPAIELAKARYEELIAVRADADSLTQALADRKVIERAKGLLMEKEKLSESDPQSLTLTDDQIDLLNRQVDTPSSNAGYFAIYRYAKPADILALVASAFTAVGAGASMPVEATLHLRRERKPLAAVGLAGLRAPRTAEIELFPVRDALAKAECARSRRGARHRGCARGCYRGAGNRPGRHGRQRTGGI